LAGTINPAVKAANDFRIDRLLLMIELVYQLPASFSSETEAAVGKLLHQNPLPR
jgi:hypothetical protein